MKTILKMEKKRLFNLSNLGNWAKKRKVQTSDTDGDKEDMSLIIFSKIECQTKQKIQVVLVGDGPDAPGHSYGFSL